MGSDYPENVIEWLTGQDRIALTLSQKKYVNTVYRMKEKYPDLVDIVAENDDGSIYATMPLSALRFQIVMLTEEQKERNTERLKAIGTSAPEN